MLDHGTGPHPFAEEFAEVPYLRNSVPHRLPGILNRVDAGKAVQRQKSPDMHDLILVICPGFSVLETDFVSYGVILVLLALRHPVPTDRDKCLYRPAGELCFVGDKVAPHADEGFDHGPKFRRGHP